jgi:hypothetical protein
MRRITIFVLLVNFLLAGCVGAPTPEEGTPTLVVTDGVARKIYTTADLQELMQVQVEDKGVTYLGVPISNLLSNAGYDPATVITVQAVASDGFSANYDQLLFQKPDAVLAYSLLDGPMSNDEGPFRMVLPGEAGKFNPRMVVELLVTHP